MENQTEQQEQCFLHQGFILKERVLGLGPQRAEKLLQTQYKLCCTSAERAGDQILLRRHFYVCPCCGISVRATKVVRISCTDCAEEMFEC